MTDLDAIALIFRMGPDSIVPLDEPGAHDLWQLGLVRRVGEAHAPNVRLTREGKATRERLVDASREAIEHRRLEQTMRALIGLEITDEEALKDAVELLSAPRPERSAERTDMGEGVR